MTQLIVDTQGARLRKNGERLEVELEGQTIQSLPMGGLRQVILMGQGVSASTPLLYHLARNGVDVVYQSQSGRFAFRVAGPLAKHSALRVHQVQAATDPQRALALARAVVIGKLNNQAATLARYGAHAGERGAWAIQTLHDQATRAAEAANLEALRGYEGSGAAAYFAAWPALFDAAHWRFRGRAYHPPTDPVNALLSFGYALLLNDIVAAVYRIGLDPALGFFHTVDYGRPSLALDLEEEFRPVIVDALTLSLVRQGLLQPGDFQAPKGGGPAVLLTDDARRFLIARYEERLAVKTRHTAQAQQLTYRQCIERQAEHMARCIAGRDAAYQALVVG
jgi:CRISPR-associated protein Cas1